MVKEEDMLSGEVRRRGPFVIEQEARRSNANGELQGLYEMRGLEA